MRGGTLGERKESGLVPWEERARVDLVEYRLELGGNLAKNRRVGIGRKAGGNRVEIG